MREIKFQSVHKHFTTGEIVMSEWGPEGEGSFRGPAYIHGYKHIANRQYTGLKDKAGKEIFEGDFFILDGVRLVVIFEDGKFCFDNTGGSYGRDFLGQDRVGRLTISGNIYENPELIKNT